MPSPLPPPGDVDARESALAALGPAATQLRRRLDDATATPISIVYRLGLEWYEGVSAAIDELEDHLGDDPVAALLLAEHALERLEIADLDDSDGHLADAFGRLEKVHAMASDRCDLRGAALARRLLELAALSELEAFHDAPNTHVAALGDAGVNALLKGR